MIQIFNRSQYEDVLIPLMNETLTKTSLQKDAMKSTTLKQD